ncbi:MAG: acyl carrier protein [Gemmatimonadetes bacterium]|nr:acyl carrier protein [Gemmatimonadota bacterium]NNM05628.1 acyl carrier protein [Gemmatimonadota bacterium]
MPTPIRDTLRAFLLENFLFTDDPMALADDDSFLERGIVDSTGIMEVITFIEETYGFTVANDEMIPENLDSVESLVAYVGKKQAL